MWCARAVFAFLLALFAMGGLPLLAGQGATAQGPAAIGDATPAFNDENVQVGSITVNEVIDPFTEFNPDFPPEAGGRFVVVNVAFDADAGQRFDIMPWTIVLQDDAGYIWNPASMILPDDALIPVLSSQTLAPGSRITGLAGFVVPEGHDPARVLLQPRSSQFVVLAELQDEPAPTVGEAVAIADSGGGSGAVTVTGIIDPLEDLDPMQSAPEDARFVLVTLVFENTSDGRFQIEPYGLLLRDANGMLWNPTSVNRLEETEIIPDITSAQLAPGDRLSGAVAFAVPEGVAPAGLYTSPESGRLLQLADFLAAGAADGPASPETGVAVTSGDEPEAPATLAAGTGDCAEMERWLAATRERMARAAVLSARPGALDDSASLASLAAEYADLAEAQRAEPAPTGADGANKALAATLNAFAAASQRMLEAEDADDAAAQEMAEALSTFDSAGARMVAIEEELARLATSCGQP